MTRLLAIAGESRSGKGTCAAVFAEEAAAAGLTSFERQLSDNGKWHLARIFKPEISRVDAVAWWEELKHHDPSVEIAICEKGSGAAIDGAWQPLQKFIQHGLQEGGRDIFGEHFWTDMIIPDRLVDPVFGYVESMAGTPAWTAGFFDEESKSGLTDLAIISDMRQVNEAQRVRSVGGLVIQMVRPHVADQYRTGSDHITERMLPLELVDHVIANDGDLVQMKGRVREVFNKLVLPWHMGDRERLHG